MRGLIGPLFVSTAPLLLFALVLSFSGVSLAASGSPNCERTLGPFCRLSDHWILVDSRPSLPTSTFAPNPTIITRPTPATVTVPTPIPTVIIKEPTPPTVITPTPIITPPTKVSPTTTTFLPAPTVVTPAPPLTGKPIESTFTRDPTLKRVEDTNCPNAYFNDSEGTVSLSESYTLDARLEIHTLTLNLKTYTLTVMGNVVVEGNAEFAGILNIQDGKLVARTVEVTLGKLYVPVSGTLSAGALQMTKSSYFFHSRSSTMVGDVTLVKTYIIASTPLSVGGCLYLNEAMFVFDDIRSDLSPFADFDPTCSRFMSLGRINGEPECLGSLYDDPPPLATHCVINNILVIAFGDDCISSDSTPPPVPTPPTPPGEDLPPPPPVTATEIFSPSTGWQLPQSPGPAPSPTPTPPSPTPTPSSGGTPPPTSPGADNVLPSSPSSSSPSPPTTTASSVEVPVSGNPDNRDDGSADNALPPTTPTPNSSPGTTVVVGGSDPNETDSVNSAAPSTRLGTMAIAAIVGSILLVLAVCAALFAMYTKKVFIFRQRVTEVGNYIELSNTGIKEGGDDQYQELDYELHPPPEWA